VNASQFVQLLSDEQQAVQVAAARALRDVGLNDAAMETVQTMLYDSTTRQTAREVQEALSMAIDRPMETPQTLEAWQAALAAGGDAQAGRRVFHSARATCASCHTIDGLGGALGPPLTNVAQSQSREQIVRAILEPSAEFPPQYQAWQITTTDGRTHTGLQLDHKSGGDIELLLTDGVVRHFEADEIEDYAALPSSLMPNGLQAPLTESELRDLVAFLETLK
jgi:putative heme-binding domain-containing protein